MIKLVQQGSTSSSHVDDPLSPSRWASCWIWQKGDWGQLIKGPWYRPDQNGAPRVGDEVEVVNCGALSRVRIVGIYTQFSPHRWRVLNSSAGSVVTDYQARWVRPI